MIVVLSTTSAYFYLEWYFDDQLRGLYIATSLVFITSMVSADLFNQIFAISILTIIQCFVTDEETFEVIPFDIIYILVKPKITNRFNSLF